MEYIQSLEKAGVKIHYPPRDTNQDDTIGVNICEENLKAISESNEVHIFWSGKSKGSLFDFGMAFALRKPIKLVNKIKPTIGKSFNNVLLALDKKVRR